MENRFIKEANNYLTEYDSIDEIIGDIKPNIKEILLDFYMNMDIKELSENIRIISSIYDRALDYRNIQNGIDFFEEEISRYIESDLRDEYVDIKLLKKRFLRLLNYVQRNATKIEPDYYV